MEPAARQGDGGGRKLGAQVGLGLVQSESTSHFAAVKPSTPYPPTHPTGRPPRYPHLKAQGRCSVFARDPPEDEDEPFEPTEEEAEEGPEALAPAEGDGEVLGGAAWSGLFSSVAEHVKYQVAGARSFGVQLAERLVGFWRCLGGMALGLCALNLCSTAILLLLTQTFSGDQQVCAATSGPAPTARARGSASATSTWAGASRTRPLCPRRRHR